MKRQALADKVMVLGVDGLDPRFARKLMDEGKMPNFTKLAARGAQRHDLVLLGSNPTVTPPQWTTLAVGCNPNVHSITQFFRHNPANFESTLYNIDSRLCKAEPIWNCTAEAGYKTLVFHWPGSAWPPTSDNPNLLVVDGTAPGAVGMGMMHIEDEIIFGASEAETITTFVPHAVTDAVEPCVVSGLDLDSDAGAAKAEQVVPMGTESSGSVLMDYTDGFGMDIGGINKPLDAAKSPIKPATGWANAPEGAKEFSLVEAGGLVRRPGLVLQNEDGVYDHVAIYKSKKDSEPYVTLYKDKMVFGIIDDAYKGDQKKRAARSMMLTAIEPDGSKITMFLSCAYDIDNAAVFHPVELHDILLENAGPFPASCQIWNPDTPSFNSMHGCWDGVAEWYTRALHHMIDNEGVEVIFSHYHAIDLQTHTIIRHLADGHAGRQEIKDNIVDWMTQIYQQTDDYIGNFLHYLDEGWTIIVTSDHAQVAPAHKPPLLGDMCGTINAGLMSELGYTVMIKDENGNDTKKVDWTKTRAVQQQGNDIFINIKDPNLNQGRGIVDPADKYELEEQIMTDLYGYKDPVTGKRVVALALRKKDAVLLGYGGDTAGDIFFATAEGYNYDHCDPLSTCYGEGDTSASPIFLAAGKGLKEGYETDRIIRQIDVAPTISVLLGCRYPAQCEGAPVYQIFSEEI